MTPEPILGIVGEVRHIALSIMERDATALVSSSIYDENGVIVGQKREEDYELELEENRGKTVFECSATIDVEETDEEGNRVIVPKAIRVRSAIVEQELRGGAMAEMFAAIGSSVFLGFFKR